MRFEKHLPCAIAYCLRQAVESERPRCPRALLSNVAPLYMAVFLALTLLLLFLLNAPELAQPQALTYNIVMPLSLSLSFSLYVSL